VSFSTHWGGGKRSSIFKSQPDGRSLPSMFATEKESSIFDSPYELSKMFRDKNNLWQCLDRMEVNVLKYISLILEVKKAKVSFCQNILFVLLRCRITVIAIGFKFIFESWWR
jgi:membrane-associated HD superfamily phosphohydrolase